jgi:CheY-like chemotaxis protein
VDDRRLLIIDDDQDIRSALGEALEEEGYRVFTASDGSEGLELVDTLHPSLVILDLFMPGMDGFAFLHAARARPDLGELPIVALSAGDRTTAGTALGAGATCFVGKPVKLQRLLDVVRELS